MYQNSHRIYLKNVYQLKYFKDKNGSNFVSNEHYKFRIDVGNNFSFQNNDGSPKRGLKVCF